MSTEPGASRGFVDGEEATLRLSMSGARSATLFSGSARTLASFAEQAYVARAEPVRELDFGGVLSSCGGSARTATDGPRFPRRTR